MKKIKTPLAVMASTMIGFQPVLAQFDDLPPIDQILNESSGNTPSNPGSGRFNPNDSFGGAGGFGSSGSSSSGKSGVLSKNKQDKMAKANIEDITNDNYPETIESFDFPNADIQDVVKAISELTGKNFILDNNVRGKITIIAPSKITVAEAYKAFLSALAINGLAIVPSGGFYKIRQVRDAAKDNIETFSGNYYPNSDQLITRIIHLKHISAENVQSDLKNLASPKGELNIYKQTNSLIMTDWGSSIDRVMKIIAQLDVPGFEDQMELIHINYARAKDLADLVDKIVNKGSGNTRNSGAGAFSAGVPRYNTQGTAGQKGSAYFMVIPDDRTNSLIVVGNKAGITRIKKLISQLDFRLPPDENGGVYVYYVRHGEAEKIAQTINGVAKETTQKPAANNQMQAFPSFGGYPSQNPQGATTGQQEIFGGDVKISADKGNNSLIIVASRQDYEVVLNLLKQIDIARDQVFVEGYIMEMNLADTNRYEIGYMKYAGETGVARSGFNGLKDLSTVLSPTAGSGTVLSFGDTNQNNMLTITGPNGSPVKIPNLLGFINFLKSSAKANLLSEPKIMAMDNQEALIEVGTKVPIGVKSQTTNGITSESIDFDDATVSLTLKPFISPTSKTIRLDINQSIKQMTNVAIPEGLKGKAVPLSTRKIKTNIVVNDGETAILGGLIKDEESEEISKVPLLGDIPILGWLFKSREAKKNKVNLMVFLTPKIVRSAEDKLDLMGKVVDERIEYAKSAGGRDPFGAVVDKLQKKAAVNNLINDTEANQPIKRQKEPKKEDTKSNSSDKNNLSFPKEDEIPVKNNNESTEVN